MLRPLVTSTVTAVILVTAASGAGADPGNYYADGIESVTVGTGSASAETEADEFGQLRADSSATGGTKRGLLGRYSSPSTGSARAYVSDGGEVTEGVYEVTVTFTGASTDESETGSGVAQGTVRSTATLGDDVTLGIADADLGSQAGTVVLQYEVSVPYDGSLSIVAEVMSLSSANGKGNAASTESDAAATLISFTKIG